MKIHFCSDLHIEFMNNKFEYQPPEGADVIVLAGDIGIGRQGVLWALETFDIPVIIIAGNHEAYGSNWKIPKLYDTLREMTQGTHVHFLQNYSVQINDVLFIGSTLWTDYDLNGTAPIAAEQARASLNDFRKIKWGEAGQVPVKLTPNHCITENLVAREFISVSLETDLKTAVVTHHAPTALSISEEFKGDALNPAYANRLENFILDKNPDIWIHGHIHTSSDYMIGNTRVLANPRGYEGHELNPDFNPDILVEI